MVSLMARILTAVGFAAAFSLPAVLFAQDGFFKGKTIRLIVGLAPGGGFDTYSKCLFWWEP
jgi:tripartite-type tricarboxylate transporter receptor subunit TctC